MNTQRGFHPIQCQQKSTWERYEVKVHLGSHTYSSVFDLEKQSMSCYRIIKNPKVLKIDFNNLWIVTRLFEFDERSAIASSLKLYFDIDVILNTLSAECALIQLD